MGDFITQYAENDNFFLFYTDFIYELSQDVADILSGYGIDMSGLLADENDRKYSQVRVQHFAIFENRVLSITSKVLRILTEHIG